jgi:hypothetical protein
MIMNQRTRRYERVMANTEKQKKLVWYSLLYRTFTSLFLAGLISFLIGLVTGLNGWKIGYTISVLGCFLSLLIMPFYLIFRTRYNKMRLAVQALKQYAKTQNG